MNHRVTETGNERNCGSVPRSAVLFRLREDWAERGGAAGGAVGPRGSGWDLRRVKQAKAMVKILLLGGPILMSVELLHKKTHPNIVC